MGIVTEIQNSIRGFPLLKWEYTHSFYEINLVGTGFICRIVPNMERRTISGIWILKNNYEDGDILVKFLDVLEKVSDDHKYTLLANLNWISKISEM